MRGKNSDVAEEGGQKEKKRHSSNLVAPVLFFNSTNSPLGEFHPLEAADSRYCVMIPITFCVCAAV